MIISWAISCSMWDIDSLWFCNSLQEYTGHSVFIRLNQYILQSNVSLQSYISYKFKIENDILHILNIENTLAYLS